MTRDAVRHFRSQPKVTVRGVQRYLDAVHGIYQSLHILIQFPTLPTPIGSPYTTRYPAFIASTLNTCTIEVQLHMCLHIFGLSATPANAGHGQITGYVHTVHCRNYLAYYTVDTYFWPCLYLSTSLALNFLFRQSTFPQNTMCVCISWR